MSGIEMKLEAVPVKVVGSAVPYAAAREDATKPATAGVPNSVSEAVAGNPGVILSPACANAVAPNAAEAPASPVDVTVRDPSEMEEFTMTAAQTEHGLRHNAADRARTQFERIIVTPESKAKPVRQHPTLGSAACFQVKIKSTPGSKLSQ
jgi:hypothetical protein